jgi:hypothetical protein
MYETGMTRNVTLNGRGSKRVMGGYNKHPYKKKNIKFSIAAHSHAKERAARVNVYLHDKFPPQGAVKSAILQGRFQFQLRLTTLKT